MPPDFKIRYSMTSVHEIILLFTKFPRPGCCKTRLIPALGPEKAALVQKIMTQSVLQKIDDFSRIYPCKTIVYHDGGSIGEMSKWLGKRFFYKKQHPGELGERMFQAISAQFSDCRAVLLVGADCPSIDSGIFQEGFAALQTNDVVIGPAFDGGYYLIGVRKSLSRESLHFLFSDITWGTSAVLAQTLKRISTLQLNHQLLKKLHDIDTPEDLQYFDYNPDA